MSDSKGPDWEALRRAYQCPPEGQGAAGAGQGGAEPPCPPSAAAAKALGTAETDAELVRDMAAERFAIMTEGGVSEREATAYIQRRYGFGG